MSAERSAAHGSRLTAAALALLLALAQSACLERRSDESPPEAQRCAHCHGDATRAGRVLDRAAPPRDLHGNDGVEYPGVGAHALHLESSGNSAPVVCEDCHVVPEDEHAPGHIDSALPAEVVFSARSRGARLAPGYDPRTRRCSDTDCHREHSPSWTRPLPEAARCGTCHGLPPPAPHPNSERCEVCHGEVIDADRAWVRPLLHVDGVVQVEDAGCSSCHDEQTGAHRVHATGGGDGRPVGCEQCHLVPGEVTSVGHLDGPPVEVALEGVARAGGSEALWTPEGQRCSETWCHGAGSGGSVPAWRDPDPLGCDGCHQSPPSGPHPQVAACGSCHAPVSDATGQIAVRARHVDGVLDVDVPTVCTACHGDVASGAVFPDTGAHAAHLLATDRARALACGECHVVPSESSAPGHIDTLLPAEVTLSGVAAAFGAEPTFENGRCANTFCHGGSFVGRRPSGGLQTAPEFDRVDGSARQCDSCHGMPPPAPHPARSDCSACHEIVEANGVFSRPELHVDGRVTFVPPAQ